MEIANMAAIVAGYLANKLKETKAVKSFFDDFTAATVDWLRPIFLIDDKEEAKGVNKMIEHLQKNPDEDLNKQAVAIAIQQEVKENSELLGSLKKLVEEIQAKTGNTEQKTNSLHITGDNNKTFQDIKDSTITITDLTNHHTGSGDNIQGDKIINHHDKKD